ncbi:MAG: hypothetical protein MUO52_00125 [Desulfobacterales bacterium]|nr:hypothetical protein [Desulfobacterales bacterium]
MTHSMNDESLKAQVEDRLADLFEGDDGSLETIEDSGSLADHPLKDLKAILLSIEWEITDETMGSLISEIRSLERVYEKDRIFHTFLQLLGSVAKYIKVNKGNAHPNATRVINSVYNALEKVALSEGMARSEKEKILLGEVARFKRLKEQVSVRKEEKKARGPSEQEVAMAPPEESPGVLESGKGREPSDPGRMSPHEAFARAVEEIKEVIRAEFKALRAEISLWRESE